MMSPLDPSSALTLLTHPFQVALMALAFGALVREGVHAVIYSRATVSKPGARPEVAHCHAALRIVG